MNINDFDQILQKWATLVSQDQRVSCILQFGSTCKKPIKKETDIDILYVLNMSTKPTRFEVFEILKNWDSNLEDELKRINDYNFIVSSHLKTVFQLDHLSPMYLDFPECSNILFDRNNDGQNLIQNIINWRIKNNTQRIQKGALWYWKYDDKDPNLPVDFKFTK